MRDSARQHGGREILSEHALATLIARWEHDRTVPDQYSRSLLERTLNISLSAPATNL
jgi:ribosome-binding protein aMBF1 (putative translation factor)